MRDSNFVVRFGWMKNKLKLKGAKLEVFALIYGFSQDGQSSFSGSFNYIADICGISRSTAIRAVNELIEIGLILRAETESRENTYFVRMDKIDELCNSVGSKMTPSNNREECQNDTNIGSKMTPPNNIYNNINNNKTNNTNAGAQVRESDSLTERVNSYTDSPELREVLFDFIKMRKSIKRPMSIRALKRALKNLDNLGKNDTKMKLARVDQSVFHCWQDLYAVKELPLGRNPQRQYSSTADEVSAEDLEYEEICSR